MTAKAKILVAIAAAKGAADRVHDEAMQSPEGHTCDALLAASESLHHLARAVEGALEEAMPPEHRELPPKPEGSP